MADNIGDDEILQLFYEESREHLDGIEEDLLSLEKQGADFDPDLVNSIFRAVHTIKGGCGFFGLDKLSSLSHAMENVFDRIRKKELVSTSRIINVLLKGADLLKEMINKPENTEYIDVATVLESIKKILDGSLSTEEKESTAESIDIKLPDGRVIFTVNKYDFDRARKAERGGSQIYLIEYDLIHDIERKHKTPWDVISELLQLSVFIDSKVDIEGVGELIEDSPIPASLPFYVLIATIIEADLIYDFLSLDESNVHVILEDGSLQGLGPVEPDKTHGAKEEKMQISTQVPKKEMKKVTRIEEPKAKEEEYIKETSNARLTAAGPEKSDKAETDLSKIKKVDASSIRVNVTLLDKLMSLAGELVLARNQLLQSTGTKNFDVIEKTVQRVDLITAELQEAIMATRMQAVGIVFNKFNRLVRDFCREKGKDVKLIIEGEDVELDKSIIESIGDPLTHLIRNSLDHGIETPELRESKGKSPAGTLKISAYHEAGHVVIIIADDGAGINFARVKSKALSTGICTQDQLENMSEKELIKLIFRPGFSTAEKITDLSGRGVGMDVVNNNLNKLGGTIDIATHEGEGTTIKIKLPLTLAIIPSLLLSAGKEKFSIPQVNLVELVRISKSEIMDRIEKIGNTMVIRLRDRLLPLVKLSDVLDDCRDNKGDFTGDRKRLRNTLTDLEEVNIAVVMAGSFQYGVIVDELLDSSEIVVKPLGQHLKKCKAYAGATILGDGRVALILDLTGISEMMQLADVGNKKEETEKFAKKAKDEARYSESDRQTLLIVHNAANQPFGIPLGLVARIEKIKGADIDNIGGRTAIKYRGGTLPLFKLEEVASVKPLEKQDSYVVVVFKVGGREVGLLLSEILDVVENDTHIDDITFKQTGVYGSSVINERITLLVDLYAIVYTVMPQWREDRKEEIKLAAESSSGGSPVVLIAEDSKFFMSQLKGFMEDAGYEVITAEDGQKAYDALLSHAERIDIVLTDIEMPNMDGFEFTRKAREDSRFSGLPILAVTSIAGSAAEQKGAEVGLDEYMIKLDRDEILEKCSHYLQNGRKKKA
ncbi:MAG: hypothetical protein A2020_14405 [Lentisphaerae bacterium GWF2_45_14]|nr:MAG: hypothetical protein A2020_14405 [Lentisphaerae bacterium GWF2_45_14]